LPGKPDIVLRGKRKAIFVHGCFWHGHSCKRGQLPSSNASFWAEKIGKNKARDLQTEEQLAELGWTTATVWQCETKQLDELRGRIAEFLAVPISSLSGEKRHDLQTN
jgi:DNA mismatch endonuclease (patch repair protein)